MSKKLEPSMYVYVAGRGLSGDAFKVNTRVTASGKRAGVTIRTGYEGSILITLSDHSAKHLRDELNKYLDIDQTQNKIFASAADLFDLYASDQIASKRFVRSAMLRKECDIRAETWKCAADELRNNAVKVSK